ncbi:MAG: hypothetical protein QNJ36_15640 [Calothrix sp. MO_167.B42]|nr:hypothetical protein [Calothrix sp. MO_167.B42]
MRKAQPILNFRYGTCIGTQSISSRGIFVSGSSKGYHISWQEHCVNCINGSVRGLVLGQGCDTYGGLRLCSSEFTSRWEMALGKVVVNHISYEGWKIKPQRRRGHRGRGREDKSRIWFTLQN